MSPHKIPIFLKKGKQLPMKIKVPAAYQTYYPAIQS